MVMLLSVKKYKIYYLFLLFEDGIFLYVTIYGKGTGVAEVPVDGKTCGKGKGEMDAPGGKTDEMLRGKRKCAVVWK